MTKKTIPSTEKKDLGLNDRFRLTLPDSWKDRTIHYFVGPEDGGVQHILNLTIDQETETDNLADYVRDHLEQIVSTMPSAEILSEKKKVLSGGGEVCRAVYKWLTPDGRSVYQKLVYLKRGEVIYSFSANFSEKTLKTIGPDVDRIISSFKPDKRKGKE